MGLKIVAMVTATVNMFTAVGYDLTHTSNYVGSKATKKTAEVRYILGMVGSKGFPKYTNKSDNQIRCILHLIFKQQGFHEKHIGMHPGC